MPALRRCLTCPALIPAGAYRGRCRTCLREWDQARGSRTDRGYGATTLDTPLGTMTYDQCRRAYQRRMDAGSVYQCADGCGRTVDPRAWHLGHGDDRATVVGPLTPTCNLSAAGRARHA